MCLINMSLLRSQPSSPAKAGDPVFRGASDRVEKPRRTGYSAFAEYDRFCGERSDQAIHLPFAAAMDCFAEPVIGLHSRDPSARDDGSPAKRYFSPATSWVVNLRREQLLTFGNTIAISTPPGTMSGLLPLDGNCE
jgi:hypothetical protein